MILPEELENQFWAKLKQFEEKQSMAYITNAERIGRKIGLEQGLEQGRHLEALNLVLRILKRQLQRKNLTKDIRTQLEVLSIEQLEDLGEALLDFTQLSDLTDWLQKIES
jgi:predicted DNA-binding ribbon-helix-helix protein